MDASGNVYLSGATVPSSLGQPDTFPVTAGAAYTNTANDGGFVAKLNAAGTQLVYSTLLPMNPHAMAIDPAGEVYLAGAANASFPTTPGAFQSTPPYPNGSGVVAKLNASGSALLYATYLSGSGPSVPQGIAIDAAGDAFVAGYTQAPDFPVTAGALQTAYFPSAQVHGVRDLAESAGNRRGLFHISRRHDEWALGPKSGCARRRVRVGARWGEAPCLWRLSFAPKRRRIGPGLLDIYPHRDGIGFRFGFRRAALSSSALRGAGSSRHFRGRFNRDQ